MRCAPPSLRNINSRSRDAERSTKEARSQMKAIETHYRGYRFRSRTEARWAVFFDKLGLRWDYEEQGYVLPKSGCYLPDFKLILATEELVYCEVKHSDADDFANDEISKLKEFANACRCKVILLTGVPDYRVYNQLLPDAPPNTLSAAFFRDYDPFVVTADAYWFQVLELDSRTGRLFFALDERALRKAFGRGYLEAVASARAARFEHGESPR